MEAAHLAARARTKTGSRACHKLRRAGEVPANLYGTSTVDGATKNTTENLAVSAYELQLLLDKHATVLEVTRSGKKDLVQLTEVQRDAFGDSVVHIDLRMIDANKPMTATVGLVFKGEAKGTRAGGLVRITLHSLEITALPRDIPAEILVRVDDIDINESLHIGELPLPEGVTAAGDPSQLVVQVVPPVEETDEDEAADAAEPGATEPEVISKGKKDEDDS